MMGTVAILAVLLGAVEGLRQRQRAFQDRAGFHRREAALWDAKPYAAGSLQFTRKSPANLARSIAFFLGRPGEVRAIRRAHYHDSLAVRYENAARRPWLPVAADPPEPE